MVGPIKLYVGNSGCIGEVVAAEMEVTAVLLECLKSLDKQDDVRIGETNLDAEPSRLEVFECDVHLLSFMDGA